MSTSSPQDPAQRRLFELLREEDQKLAEVESMIAADVGTGRLSHAEAEIKVAGARDAHLRACQELRRRYEAGELGGAE